jgi:hypothetical protein
MGFRTKLKSLKGWPQRIVDWMTDNFILDPTGREEEAKRLQEQRERLRRLREQRQQ